MELSLIKSKIAYVIKIISLIIVLVPTLLVEEEKNSLTLPKKILNKTIIFSNPKTTSNYYLLLEIPKIELYKKIYGLDNEFNNLKYNIELLPQSNFEQNLFFLAAHSGTNKNAYFNKVKFLEVNDLIYLTFFEQKEQYIYKISEIYLIEKNGYLKISERSNNILYLITCSTDYYNKQLIVKATNIGKENVN